MVKKYIYKIHYGGFSQLGDRFDEPKFPILNSLKKVFVKEPFQFDNYSLRVAVNLWCNNKKEAKKKYGDINTWDVSQVTNMNRLFANKDNFNSNISNWDTSSVTNMIGMFNQAKSFNNGATDDNLDHPLLTNGNKWNTSRVTNMNSMFSEARLFNQDISNWDTSSVTNMKNMFYYAIRFNQSVSNWDTSSVTGMKDMFNHAISFNNGATNDDPNHPLLTNGDAWNTSSVTDMNSMFSGAELFNQDISNWDTSKVKNMSLMFSNTGLFNQDISNWDTSNVTNMERMFSYAKSFKRLTIGRWIIRNDCITDYMFEGSGITKKGFVDENGNRIADFNRKIGKYFDINEEKINYLKITIRTLAGTRFDINVNPYDQISHVKQIIQNHLKVDQDLRLSTPTIPEMDTNRSINSYNIYQNGENLINLVMKIKQQR